MVAAARARHLLEDKPIVLDDPYAIHLTSPGRRFMLQSRLLRRILKALVGKLLEYGGEALGRSRYAEDLLAEKMKEGVSQFVSVGAGFDSFVLRRSDLVPALSIYELDHPATQKEKITRLEALGYVHSRRVGFVPVDFEKETIAEVLAGTSFLPDEPAFFSWLGVVGYLTEEAVFASLTSIAESACAGSYLVFDFPCGSDAKRLVNQPTFRKFKWIIERTGEIGRSVFEPDDLIGRVESLGFELVECLAPKDKDERYFSNRSDGLKTLPFTYYISFKRV